MAPRNSTEVPRAAVAVEGFPPGYPTNLLKDLPDNYGTFDGFLFLAVDNKSNH